jgi:hypothetical protein
MSALLAVLFVTVQAVMVNSIADQFRLMDSRSWLPGVAFALITALLPAFLYLSAALVSSFLWSGRCVSCLTHTSRPVTAAYFRHRAVYIGRQPVLPARLADSPCALYFSRNHESWDHATTWFFLPD